MKTSRKHEARLGKAASVRRRCPQGSPGVPATAEEGCISPAVAAGRGTSPALGRLMPVPRDDRMSLLGRDQGGR